MRPKLYEITLWTYALPHHWEPPMDGLEGRPWSADASQVPLT